MGGAPLCVAGLWGVDAANVAALWGVDAANVAAALWGVAAFPGGGFGAALGAALEGAGENFCINCETAKLSPPRRLQLSANSFP